jgi:tRNA(Ile)-lysidine synthetase-like protein
MKLDFIPPGKYVVAVSGGVDSMVLLDVLAKIPNLDLVVAHFDHGVRPDSAEDRHLVAQAAQHYELPYIYEEGHLGAAVSEAQARQARYAFLERAREQSGAQAIITAHHQDDLIETMLINLIRGTNRKGLTSLRSHSKLLRPLLKTGKGVILQYAADHTIQWHEDSTNASDAYLRNRLRQTALPHMTAAQRTQLLHINQQMTVLNREIDEQVAEILQIVTPHDILQRQQFALLPDAVSREVMAAWLRDHDVRNLSAKQIERLVTAAKTARPATVHNIGNRKNMKITLKFAEIVQEHLSQRST